MLYTKTAKLVLFSTLIQGIYKYIPETNHVYRVHNIVDTLWLQYVVHVMPFPMLNVLYFSLVHFQACGECPIRLFSEVPNVTLSTHVVQIFSE
jgi:hypothetical protein